MSHDDGQHPPDPPPDESTATVPPPARHPAFIGDYRIVRQLGQGGMGVVYEAEQRSPRRAVALKVIRSGAYVDEQAVRLFRREAQALARLKHPGVAAIYESGRTEDGQHFFAMELVRGETLHEYIRRQMSVERPVGPDQKPRLSAAELRDRLALLSKVCDAVGYAHQRGVIHRDLKPSNILVQRQDPTGRVPDIKILDFGLARITDSDVAMSTIVTGVGQVLGTLPYMSPEQLRGHADEIDLRSDVYSLGVILYELVSGQLPFALQGLALPEAMRVVFEEPPPPLTSTVAGARRLDPDLATIVRKALEKEPSRRYQSATALSDDLQRYLTDQPILARPPSAAYQFRKVVARHKAPFAFMLALFVILLGFAVTMTVQARHIAQERDRANLERDRANLEATSARTVSDFMVGLFKVADPGEARGKSITAKEILDAGAARIDADLRGQQQIQSRMMNTIGEVYFNLGLYDRASTLLERAVDIRRNALGENRPEVAESLNLLGNVRAFQGRYDEAVTLLLHALEIQQRELADDDPAIGWTQYNLGALYSQMGDVAAAQDRLESAQAIFEERLGPDSQAVAWCVNDLGQLHEYGGDLRGAEQLYARAFAIKEKVLPADHPDLAISLNNLGYVKARLGEFPAAREMLERALLLTERSMGLDTYQASVILWGLGETWSLAGDPAKARPFLERALDIQARSLAPDHVALGSSLHSLAIVLRDLGKPVAAEAMFKRAMDVREKRSGRGDTRLAETLEAYAVLLRTSGRNTEAEALQSRAGSVRAQAQQSSTLP